jgi:osmotically-inducible protein OsmY
MKLRAVGRWVLLGLVCVGGCKAKDTDTLVRIGRKTAARLDAATGGARGKLAGGVQAVRGSLSDSTPDSRVALRLRWDRYLAKAQVKVSLESPGVVVLEGTIRDTGYRQRAVDLAGSTLGVERVVDKLTVGGR